MSDDKKSSSHLHLVGGVESIGSVRELEELHYCINGFDHGTEKTGTFAYDEYINDNLYMMFSISPVFDSVDEFYAWAKEQGFLYHSLTQQCVMLRDFPSKKRG